MAHTITNKHKRARGQTQADTYLYLGSFIIVYFCFFLFLLVLLFGVGMETKTCTTDHTQAQTSKGTKTNKYDSFVMARLTSSIVVFSRSCSFFVLLWEWKKKRAQTITNKHNRAGEHKQANTFFCFRFGSFIIVHHRFFSFLLFMRFVVGMEKEKDTTEDKQAQTSKGTTNNHEFCSFWLFYNRISMFFLFLAIFCVLVWAWIKKRAQPITNTHKRAREQQQPNAMFSFWLVCSRLSLFFSFLLVLRFVVGMEKEKDTT